jgi:hypothetical protein
MYGYFLNTNICISLHNKGKGGCIDFMIWGKRQAEMFWEILSDFDVLWTTKERTDSSIVEIIHVSGVNDSLKSHRVTKQTNPWQVDNLITNKSVVVYEASRRILNILC